MVKCRCTGNEAWCKGVKSTWRVDMKTYFDQRNREAGKLFGDLNLFGGSEEADTGGAGIGGVLGPGRER